MELSEHEKDLLRLYRADRKKKRKSLWSVILITLFSLGGIKLIYENKDTLSSFFNSSSQNLPKKDMTPPTLVLKKSNIEIIQGDKIDIAGNIKSAYDSTDGDLTEEVSFNKIDTKELGEHKIIYTVTDHAGNKKISCLDVLVKEAPKETDTDDSSSSAPIYSTENTSENNTEETQKPSVEVPPPEPVEPSTQYFLFSDGYTMDNVANACTSALKSSGRSGMCSPIQDDDGIYLGMRLDLN